jgi:hypothetical protein
MNLLKSLISGITSPFKNKKIRILLLGAGIYLFGAWKGWWAIPTILTGMFK